MRLNHVLLSVLVVGIVAKVAVRQTAFRHSKMRARGTRQRRATSKIFEDSKVVFIQSDGGNGSGDADRPPSATDPNNASKDSDCDGLTDRGSSQTSMPTARRPARSIPTLMGMEFVMVLSSAAPLRSMQVACLWAMPIRSPKPHRPRKIATAMGSKMASKTRRKNGKPDSGETKPEQADSDNDGVFDEVEDTNKDGKVDAGESDPRKADTDGDGINDGLEIRVVKTDPTKPDTDGDGGQPSKI